MKRSILIQLEKIEGIDDLANVYLSIDTVLKKKKM